MNTESPHTTGIVRSTPCILSTLLKDCSLSTPEHTAYIKWATDDYTHSGQAEIMPENVSGPNKDTIMPRVLKDSELQASRSKIRAEVFTPAWICNAQNNLIDECWFGYKNVFNTEVITEDGTHTWLTKHRPVRFPEGKTWKAYIRCRRMEMACGESPYLVSRYDTTTGAHIELRERIGIADRKFRVINENTPAEPTKHNKRHWLRKAYQVLQSIYGFDWQGDNVFLSRESVFHSFCDYYAARWGRLPHIEAMRKAAEIISWNIWQMDGTSFCVPYTSHPCIVMEWHGTEPLNGKRIPFANLMKKKKKRR